MPHVFEFIHFKDRRDLPHLAVVLLLISGIVLGVYLSLQPQIFNKQASESSLVEVEFIPESIRIQKGKNYEVKLGVNPKAERVTAVQLAIGYDPENVTILEVKNEGFLPINLKTQDSYDGNLSVIYGGTVETQATQPGMLATIKFKVLDEVNSEISIKPNSQVSVSSQEGNVLTSYSKLELQTGDDAIQAPAGTQEDVKYPDNLLLEKAFFPDSSPFVRDFREAIEPKPVIKPERLKPQLSEAYLKQLGKDIFITPIVSLNEVLQESVGGVVAPPGEEGP